VHSGVGGITESDVALAGASKAVVIGFNVRANTQAKQAADAQGIEIRYYSIIYDLVDDVKSAMSGLLAPTVRENFLGYATIKQVFNISKVGKVAGCVVTEGKVERGAKVRLLRDKVVIHEGTLSILKRFKDDVKEVPAGQECGMAFANYQDIREGDEIECSRWRRSSGLSSAHALIRSPRRANGRSAGAAHLRRGRSRGPLPSSDFNIRPNAVRTSVRRAFAPLRRARARKRPVRPVSTK
jgi:translation initiation factor IF-2